VQGHRPQQREQSAHRFADARGRLGQQAALVGGGFVDGLGQAALPGAKGALRKSQFFQRRIPGAAVPRLLLRPGRECSTALRQGFF
jgi:hypothetical protein